MIEKLFLLIRRKIMKRYIIPFCLVLLVLMLLPSCAEQEDGERYTGILASDEVIASIKKEMEDRENSLMAAEGDVFWTASGSLWHSTYKCSYIINSKNIYHGTLEEAKLAGKVSPCKRCGASDTGASSDERYAELENEPICDGDVFFTKGDVLWHAHLNCPQLDGEEKVYHSSREDAELLGKILPCDECTGS